VEENCRIGAGAAVSNAILLRGATVPPTNHVCDTVVMGAA
jgi:NDP-sugar pyrophosphorylase family protein